ncbi:MAG: hypothetical protein DKT66_09390 [Candidatus Melainabacteria bacterium]|nr:MAG: hypothetical protein DKT66_09390 [Candidatus Melainabacteria bacterium]
MRALSFGINRKNARPDSCDSSFSEESTTSLSIRYSEKTTGTLERTPALVLILCLCKTRKRLFVVFS